MEIIESKEQKENIEKKWIETQGAVVHHQVNIHNVRVPEREERKRDRENIWRNNVWKVPKFDEIMNINIKEAQWTPNKISLKRRTL